MPYASRDEITIAVQSTVHLELQKGAEADQHVPNYKATPGSHRCPTSSASEKRGGHDVFLRTTAIITVKTLLSYQNAGTTEDSWFWVWLSHYTLTWL
jgi:hypothetical protein